MRKSTSNILSRILNITRKNEEKREPRNYNALVESFKTKVQVN
ncbi:hypothetical protein SHK09_14410 [Polaribacter sp. PL03]|nr:hypothetical protein [Polaribacter sp. PL03]MDX6747988.1 hypothetical protein [Polaribacter sp. PL03]